MLIAIKYYLYYTFNHIVDDEPLIAEEEIEEANEVPPTGAPNKGKKHLVDQKKLMIFHLWSKGYSERKIGEELGIGKTTVHNLITKWKKTGSLDRKSGQGRKRITSPTTDRYITTSVKRDRFITAKAIKEERGLGDICENTIRNRIKESGEFDSYWAVRKPFISARNRRIRVEWAKAHLNWTVNDWRRILWSDESPFVMAYNGRVRVWRMANERYSPRCCRGTLKHDKKINVWGCFSAHGVGDLMRVEGILVKEKYLDILDQHMVPSADRLFGREDWTFQQDNDPKHTAIVVRDWFIENEVPLMPWPAQSPDLNPIENLWSVLDKRAQFRKCANEEELFQVLQREWQLLPTDLLERLVESMPRRCQAVIDSKGFATKY
jgi:hypothetical protein